MTRIISSFEDTASIFYRGRAAVSALADILRMATDEWKKRLDAAIKAKGLSARAASMNAGLGPGTAPGTRRISRGFRRGKKTSSIGDICLDYPLLRIQYHPIADDDP